jgi:hypothetical protein
MTNHPCLFRAFSLLAHRDHEPHRLSWQIPLSHLVTTEAFNTTHSDCLPACQQTPFSRFTATACLLLAPPETYSANKHRERHTDWKRDSELETDSIQRPEKPIFDCFQTKTSHLHPFSTASVYIWQFSTIITCLDHLYCFFAQKKTACFHFPAPVLTNNMHFQ